MSSALANNTYTVQPAGCTWTLIIPDITKTEYSICFIIHCFGENNDKHTVARNLSSELILLLGIMHCVRNLQIVTNLRAHI